jgi:hypothetical protein
MKGNQQMPIGMDPNATFEYVLKSDRENDPAPAFKILFLSARKWQELTRTEEAFDQSENAPDMVDHVLSIVEAGVVGWSNMNDQFDKTKFGEILTIDELMELKEAVMAQTPTAEDKKKLD